MVSQDSLLVTLVKLVDRLPMPMAPSKRERGHPRVYSDRLFLKALVIMIVRHLHKVNELLSVLAQPTAEMAILRGLPSRTGALPGTSHLGTALKVAAGYIARANWLPGSPSARLDPALGDLWAGGRNRQYGAACPRRRLTPETPHTGRAASHLH